MDGESIGPVVGGRARVASRVTMGALPQSRNAPVVTNGNDPRTRQRRAKACMFRLRIHGSSPVVNGKRLGPNSQTISWIQYNWSSVFRRIRPAVLPETGPPDQTHSSSRNCRHASCAVSMTAPECEDGKIAASNAIRSVPRRIFMRPGRAMSTSLTLPGASHRVSS